MTHWRKIMRLSIVLSKINFSFLGARHRFKRPPDFYTVVLFCFIASLSGVIYYYYAQAIARLYATLAAVAMTAFFDRLLFFVLSIILTFVGAFLLLNLFCFEKDTAHLLLFPLQPCDIFTGKYLLLLCLCYALELVLLLPAAIVHTLHEGRLSGAVTYGAIFLLLPILTLFPLLLITTLCLKLSCLLHRLKTVLVGLGILLCLTANIFLRLLAADAFTKPLAAHLDAFILPFPYYDAYLHAPPGLQLLCALLVLPASVLLYRTLSHGIIGANYIPAERRTRPRRDTSPYQSSGKFGSYFKKECKRFFRTPVYVVNGLFWILLPPFMLPLSFHMTSAAESIEQIRALVSMPAFSVYAILFALAVVVLPASLNAIAASSFSREGASYWIVQLIPYSMTQQTLVKLLFSTSLSLAGLFINSVIFWLYFQYSPLQLLTIVFLGTLFILLYNILGVLIDRLHPKLTWVNESEAIKQNINVLLATLAGIVLSLGCLYAVVTMLQKDWPPALVITLLTSSLIVFIALGFKCLCVLKES